MHIMNDHLRLTPALALDLARQLPSRLCYDSIRLEPALATSDRSIDPSIDRSFDRNFLIT